MSDAPSVSPGSLAQAHSGAGDHATASWGLYVFDFRGERAWYNGRELQLAPQPRRVLLFLARRHGQLVTRDELRLALWDGRFLEFDQALNFAIRQVRRAVSDVGGDASLITTVRRRGYRMASESTADKTPAPPRHANSPLVRPWPVWTPRRWTLAGAAVVALFICATVVWSRREERPTDVRVRVASHDTDTSEAAAITRSLIAALVDSPNLRIVDRGDVAFLSIDVGAGPRDSHIFATLQLAGDTKPRWRSTVHATPADFHRLAGDLAQDVADVIRNSQASVGNGRESKSRADTVVVRRASGSDSD